MKRPRSEKLRRAVEAGLRNWPEYRPLSLELETVSGALPDRDVVRSMPRRRPAHAIDTSGLVLPMARRVHIRAGILRPIYRLMVWIWAALSFFSGNALDWLRGRASIERRAIRLRLIFERVGASFSKLGQQLSIRADLLPYAYCVELGKMLDRAKPFPTAQAILIIERSLARPLYDVFEVFDPEPIGAASLSCVFQAKLKSGETVAVKVRRPNIDKDLAADLRALDWLLGLAEIMTFIRPGLTKGLRSDLRKILFGELNFRSEARYTEMFRLRSIKNGFNLTAPRVYFEFCTEEVLVSELVSGVWMWELINAVDTNDREFLTDLAVRGIEPKAVARVLIQALHHELLEEIFFHADPHPANLVVLPDNRICFIDFGAIGRFSTQTRAMWREMQMHMKNGDVERMVNASLNLVGGLPPIDVQKLREQLNEIFADWVYAISSTDAEWWERSTAQTWLRYINLARENGLPVTLELLQFLRATLLYDSTVTRLNRDIDFVYEWKLYVKKTAKTSRDRVQKSMRKRMLGPTNQDYMIVEQLGDAVTQLFFRLQRSIEDPVLQFRNMVGKIAYTVSMLLNFTFTVAVFAGVAAIGTYLAKRWFGWEIPWSAMLETVKKSGWIQLGLFLLVLGFLRRVLIRLKEPDKKPESD